MRKYEFTGERKIWGNRTLLRIVAAKDFGDVKTGEVGGWIENESNLSHVGNCWVYNDGVVYGNGVVCGNGRVDGNGEVKKGTIIGKVNRPYEDIFQHQCQNRVLTAILTEDNEILYTIGCQENITKEEFIERIYNEGGGLKENPHRQEYLAIIKCAEMYFNENIK